MNKVVKRICKELGYYVRQLHRTHIGSLAVDVPSGDFRMLTDEDKEALFTNMEITKETFGEQ